MATVKKSNRKAFDRLLKASTKEAKFPGETIVMFNPRTKEGGILTASGADYYYPSIVAIKRAAHAAMMYDGKEVNDASFWNGNDEEIKQLAIFAGLEPWIIRVAKRLGVEYEN